MGLAPRSARSAAADAETITRHFRDNYPILLDGALPLHAERRRLVRQARVSLARGPVDPELLPAEILRETLGGLAATAESSVKAGLTAIGPKQARIWWDASILDNLDDVLARLDRPRAVLRFYDVTDLDPEAGRWNGSFDVDIDLGDHGHTAHLVQGDRSYVVDLGYVYADGRFLRLARTNPAALPHEGRGVPDAGEVARCLLRPRNRRAEALLAPDAAAREWVENRPDSALRDAEAELTVHMVYRAFLKEGPRALRRMPRPARRDSETLEREFAQRKRTRERSRAKTGAQSGAAQAFLVARLDVERPVAAARYTNIPAPIRHAAWKNLAEGGRFAWHNGISAAARSGRLGDVQRYFSRKDEVTRVEAEIEATRGRLVRSMPVTAELTASLYSAPVFEAARSLRETLTGMRALDLPVLNDGAEVARVLAAAKLGGRGRPAIENRERDEPEVDAERVFGGSEAKRMAKAGVRITRMALTLEGKMRPGARLKVAGKLVHADADGRFRLECVLSGKKASIPMRAGVSVGGEARSLINVEWEKRAGAEKKKV